MSGLDATQTQAMTQLSTKRDTIGNAFATFLSYQLLFRDLNAGEKLADLLVAASNTVSLVSLSPELKALLCKHAGLASVHLFEAKSLPE